MISLGQWALLAIGCWVGTRLAYATALPFPLLLVVTGAITCAIGVLVGLPALRLSGLYLALITLMFAGATTIVLAAIDFPNGGGGFTGGRRPSTSRACPRFADRRGPRRYLVLPLRRPRHHPHASARPRARSEQAGPRLGIDPESEPAALAAGVNITLYKLWAFALASFMTGVAGCLLAAQVGVPRAINFQTQDSLTLAATALIGGIFSLWGAVVAGVFGQLLPFLLSSGQLWGWVVTRTSSSSSSASVCCRCC